MAVDSQVTLDLAIMVPHLGLGGFEVEMWPLDEEVFQRQHYPEGSSTQIKGHKVSKTIASVVSAT